jgi:hypothetical protein
MQENCLMRLGSSKKNNFTAAKRTEKFSKAVVEANQLFE